jgi:N-acetylmuramoyl-L-alanine amidase
VRRLTGRIAVVLITAGAVFAGPEVMPVSFSSRAPVAPPVVTTTLPVQEAPVTTSTTVTTLPAGPPVAWIAPAGVPVAITGIDGETIEVLTPCGDAAHLDDGTPIYEVDVVIDPGHGGPIDTGAVARSGLTEKEINLRVSLALHGLLTERGIAAMLTRTEDYPIPIGVRAAYANIVGARAVVSIHHNAPQAPASAIPGVETFVQHENPESARLGGLLQQAAAETLSQFDVAWQRSPDAGVMTVLNANGDDAYGMVRIPEAPSALIELGYIANPAEAELYESPAYVPAVASALADGIEAFLTTNQTGAPLVEGRVFNPNRGVGRDQCIEPDLSHP